MFKIKKNTTAENNQHYHLILKTLCNKPCITQEMASMLGDHLDDILHKYNGGMIQMDYQSYYIHAFFDLPQSYDLDKIIKKYKKASSIRMYSNFSRHLKDFYSRREFWADTYRLLTSD